MFKDTGIPEDHVEIREAWRTGNVGRPSWQNKGSCTVCHGDAHN